MIFQSSKQASFPLAQQVDLIALAIRNPYFLFSSFGLGHQSPLFVLLYHIHYLHQPSHSPTCRKGINEFFGLAAVAFGRFDHLWICRRLGTLPNDCFFLQLKVYWVGCRWFLFKVLQFSLVEAALNDFEFKGTDQVHMFGVVGTDEVMKCLSLRNRNYVVDCQL